MRTILAAAISAVILAVLLLSYGIASPPATPAAIYAADPEGKIYKIDPNCQQVVDSRAVKFSPVALWSYDGKLLAADGKHDRRFIIIDPATGSPRSLNAPKLSSLNCVYVNNGTVLMGTADPPGLVRIDLVSGRQLASLRLPEEGHPSSLAVTADGRAYVADAGTKSLHVINLKSLTSLGRYSTLATYTNMCLGKDGKLYATASSEDSLGEWIDVWDTRKNVRIQSIRGLLPMEQSFLPEEGPVSQRHMVFIDDLNLLCALSFLNPGIKITSKRWPLLIAVDVTSGKLAWCLKQSSATEEPNIILRGPDHNLYLATNKRIAVIEAKTGKVKKNIPLKNIWGMTKVDDGPARKVVERFCAAEFEGDQAARFDFVRFSPARKAQEKKKDDEFWGRAVSWDEDPLTVVASFHVVNMEVHGKSAVAVVRYEQLARTEASGLSRKFVRDRKVNDVKYNVTLDGKEWRVLDPPEPHASLKAILSWYKDLFSLTEPYMHPRQMTEMQKDWYRKRRDDYEFLRSLSN